MSNFKKLNTKIHQKDDAVATADNIYWKQLGVPVLVKEFGPIDYVDFSPIEPYCFAITCSVRVQVYNPITKLVVKNISRFRENAYGAVFRSDGKILSAGGDETNVKLFDVASKSLLRLFKGHSAPVHRTAFIDDKPQIVSFSDDKCVKLWDIPTEKELISFNEHTDYIRSGATNPMVPNVVLSGGYDNTIKMYDLRSEKSVLSVNHGSPIESLLFLPAGGIFVSAGGTDLKIWDTLAGGKLLGSISQHHKTITCLRLASEGKRLLSGSLDRHVKIYDLSTFGVVHTLDYPNGVLSLGVSQNDDTVVAGLVDGLVAIRRRDVDKPAEKLKKPAFYKFTPIEHANVDTVVHETKPEAEAKHDRCLRKFEHSKALDCVFLKYIAYKNPQITVSVIQELIRRHALKKALIGRDMKSITTILRFFVRNITDYRFTRILIDAINIFIDVYEDSISLFPPEVGKLFLTLTTLLKEELELTNELATVQGAMHLLLASSLTETKPKKPTKLNLTPSENASKNFVINIS